MNNFKQYKFKSNISLEILEAVELFGKLGYKYFHGDFPVERAVRVGGICVWDDSEITFGYLEDDTFKDITLEELKSMVCDVSTHNVKTTVSGNYTLREQYKHLIGVQFNKNIYSFSDQRYVHNVGRDKDGDVCVVDQYGVDYKLRDVEFYVSDEHEDTLVYTKYVKHVGGI